MNSFETILKYLYGLQLFGIKVGLSNIRKLVEALGHPERRFPSIHIAGTNGKGSTASMIASILTASGYRTGLYTSPHLVHFSERIRIDGVKISEEEIAGYTKVLKPVIDKCQATFFEATTAIAFQYFADRNVDIAVIETGLGGRLDATNVLTPLVSVITTIGLEHTEYLGNTLSRIAWEKGGIIKKSVPCITGVTEGEAIEQLRTISRSKGSRLVEVSRMCTAHENANTLGGLEMSLRTRWRDYPHLRVSLPGAHQLPNACLAVLACEYVRNERGFLKIHPESIVRGLSSIQRLSGLRGRLDVLITQPLLIADVAHNHDGVRTLVDALRKLLVGKCVVIFGVMKDKPSEEMIRCLSPITRVAVCVRPHTERALETSAIAAEFQHSSVRAIAASSVECGLLLAEGERRDGEAVIVAGSHYVAGELLNLLNIIP